jgi:hypothetical protein
MSPKREIVGAIHLPRIIFGSNMSWKNKDFRSDKERVEGALVMEK